MTALQKLRHSTSHVLAAAVLRLFPQAKLDIGPPTAEGFYYDFDLEESLDSQHLEKIEKEMRNIIEEKQPFIRKEVTRKEAERLIEASGQATYKLGRLADIPEGETISFYRNGDFEDLCAGQHVEHTHAIEAFKLLRTAGIYHRGKAENKQLQRIYGTAFPDGKSLRQHLYNLQEAKKRDHRRLGQQLDLFTISDQVGAGLVLWTPRGCLLRTQLEDFLKELLKQDDYELVATPHIGKLDLFRTSGHFPYYQSSQFAPIVDRDCPTSLKKENQGDLDGYLLKPMNCPFHISLYQRRPYSYRDLPVRLAEFGTVYRREQSGEIGGLTRVRGFTQDDAHIFCQAEQTEEELLKCLKMVQTVLAVLGMQNYRVRIGLSDELGEKYVGDPQSWKLAESSLKHVAEQLKLPFEEGLGEAAFYGPKIDFIVQDVLKRQWQLGTVQLDYNLPERFKLKYTDRDGQAKRPVLIHRAPFGSLERFIGILIEHFGGDFPLWLAPEQVRFLSLHADCLPCVEAFALSAKQAKLRVSVDKSEDTLGGKIRKAENMKVPYVLIVGKKEVENKEVSVRSRISSLKGPMKWESLLELLVEKVKTRVLPQSFYQKVKN